VKYISLWWFRRDLHYFDDVLWESKGVSTATYVLIQTYSIRIAQISQIIQSIVDLTKVIVEIDCRFRFLCTLKKQKLNISILNKILKHIQTIASYRLTENKIIDLCLYLSWSTSHSKRTRDARSSECPEKISIFLLFFGSLSEFPNLSEFWGFSEFFWIVIFS
jgi:hypothetical protein